MKKYFIIKQKRNAKKRWTTEIWYQEDNKPMTRYLIQNGENSWSPLPKHCTLIALVQKMVDENCTIKKISEEDMFLLLL